MKLKTDANIPHFLEAVHRCKGSVHFTTPEGDNLNLKSTLSHFVFASVVAEQLRELNGDVHLTDSADMELLDRFFV